VLLTLLLAPSQPADTAAGHPELLLQPPRLTFLGVCGLLLLVVVLEQGLLAAVDMVGLLWLLLLPALFPASMCCPISDPLGRGLFLALLLPPGMVAARRDVGGVMTAAEAVVLLVVSVVVVAAGRSPGSGPQLKGTLLPSASTRYTSA
jgi:hypothetical protein